MSQFSSILLSLTPSNRRPPLAHFSQRPHTQRHDGVQPLNAAAGFLRQSQAAPAQQTQHQPTPTALPLTLNALPQQFFPTITFNLPNDANTLLQQQRSLAPALPQLMPEQTAATLNQSGVGDNVRNVINNDSTRAMLQQAVATSTLSPSLLQLSVEIKEVTTTKRRELHLIMGVAVARLV